METGMREALDLLEKVAVSLHRAGEEARPMVRSGARSGW